VGVAGPADLAGCSIPVMSALETLAWGYGLVEGPRADAYGNLYFSDVHKGGVHRRAPNGVIETVVPKRRGVGGISFHADGGLVISGRNICHVRDGETRVLFAPDAPAPSAPTRSRSMDPGLRGNAGVSMPTTTPPSCTATSR
jgi:sugar lactone lactonase YvrE